VKGIKAHENYGLILRTSSDFIVRQLLRPSDPVKAKESFAHFVWELTFGLSDAMEA
jgi:hypothetical protein